MKPGLSLRNVSKTFSGTRVLKDFSMDLRPGEVRALIGQNGSGKSTLVKILAGVYTPDDGASASLNGAEFKFGSAASAASARIRFVHQDLGLVGSLSASDNYMLSSAAQRPLQTIVRSRERRSLQEALRGLGYDIDPKTPVESLSPSERTAIALVRAVGTDSNLNVLVLDEPTASMPRPEVARLFRAIREMAGRGTSVLFISHHLDEVLELVDNITVLREGEVVADVASSSSSVDELANLMLGKQRSEIVAGRSEWKSNVSQGGPHRLSVEALRGGTVQDLSFNCDAGQIVGVAGLTGSGRENVAGLLAGLRERAGTVGVDGEVLRGTYGKTTLRSGMQYIPSDRHESAILHGMSLQENLTIADLRSLRHRGQLSRSAELCETSSWIRRMSISPPDPNKEIDHMSGGNQQKVVVARALRTRPTVLVFDEPTQGVDIGAKAIIHEEIRGAARQGAAVVVCSNDCDELEWLCDTVIVLYRGLVSAVLSGRDVSAERIEQEQLAPGAELSAQKASAMAKDYGCAIG